jgi:hypothetical protein
MLHPSFTKEVEIEQQTDVEQQTFEELPIFEENQGEETQVTLVDTAISTLTFSYKRKRRG